MPGFMPLFYRQRQPFALVGPFWCPCTLWYCIPLHTWPSRWTPFLSPWTIPASVPCSISWSQRGVRSSISVFSSVPCLSGSPFSYDRPLSIPGFLFWLGSWYLILCRHGQAGTRYLAVEREDVVLVPFNPSFKPHIFQIQHLIHNKFFLKPSCRMICVFTQPPMLAIALYSLFLILCLNLDTHAWYFLSDVRCPMSEWKTEEVRSPKPFGLDTLFFALCSWKLEDRRRRKTEDRSLFYHITSR